MKTYEYGEKAKCELAKQRSLEALDARLARHERVTRFTLSAVLILAGMSLALLAAHLFSHAN
jgi:hypothetical protein